MANELRRLERFNQCPHSYYHKYVKNVAEKMGEAGELAMAVRFVVEQYGADAAAELVGIRTLMDYAKLAIANFSLLSEEDHLQDIATMAGRFIAFLKQQNHVAPFEDYYLTSGADGFTAVNLIKTGWSRAVDPKESIFNKALAHAVRALTGEAEVVINIHNLRRGQVATAVMGGDEMDEGAEWVSSTQWEILRASDKGVRGFKASPGAGCAYCAVQAKCPKLKNVAKLADSADPKGVLSADEAIQTAEALFVLEGYLGKLKKSLNAYTKANGTVKAAEGFYGHYRSVGYEAKPDALVPWLQKKQMKLDTYLSVKKAGVESLLENPLYGREVRTICTEKVSSTFSHREEAPETDLEKLKAQAKAELEVLWKDNEQAADVASDGECA